MRKRKTGRRLSRKSQQRKALLHSLASALLLKEKIQTTEAKARELSRFVEKQITLAKKGSLYSQKLLNRYFILKIVNKLSKEIAPRYKERKGGYTRIIKLGPRKEDGARIVIIELVK